MNLPENIKMKFNLICDCPNFCLVNSIIFGEINNFNFAYLNLKVQFNFVILQIFLLFLANHYIVLNF